MEFVVYRTSDKNNKPCKEAYPVEATYQDRRMAKTLSEARLPKNKHWSDEWFSSGKNHREEYGYVVRDLELEAVYIVKLSRFKDLLAFIYTYEECIIGASNYKEYPLLLEIYDNYRE